MMIQLTDENSKRLRPVLSGWLWELSPGVEVILDYEGRVPAKLSEQKL